VSRASRPVDPLTALMASPPGKYNIFDALRGMWDAFQIMGEDTLDHNSWEVSEQWMKQNLMLVDNEVIAISNRWRLKRGEPAITRETLLAT
jgi:hypothetical protein